jgi:MFS family permease
MVAGGIASDRMARRAAHPLDARRRIVVACQLLAAGLMLIVPFASASAAIALLTSAVAVTYFAFSNNFAIVNDACRPERLGSIIGIVAMAATTAGVAAPALSGFMIQYAGGYTGLFMLSAAVPAAMAIVVLMCARAPAPRPAGESLA